MQESLFKVHQLHWSWLDRNQMGGSERVKLLLFPFWRCLAAAVKVSLCLCPAGLGIPNFCTCSKRSKETCHCRLVRVYYYCEVDIFWERACVMWKMTNCGNDCLHLLVALYSRLWCSNCNVQQWIGWIHSRNIWWFWLDSPNWWHSVLFNWSCLRPWWKWSVRLMMSPFFIALIPRFIW